VPVIRSILISAKGDIEARVTKEEKHLTAQGLEPTDALVQALSNVLHEPGGDRIVRVIAAAGAAETTSTKGGDHKDISNKFAQVLSRADKVDLDDEEGLAFIGTIIAAAAAVIGAATAGIAAAVRKARARRSKLKKTLTPLNAEEIEDIVTIAASTHATFESALMEITGLIAESREGRTKFLLDPAKDNPKKGIKAGSKVNEYRDVRDAFIAKRRAIEELIAADKRRKNLIYGGAAAGGVAILGVMFVLSRR
jgi:hypothetical protein